MELFNLRVLLEEYFKSKIRDLSLQIEEITYEKERKEKREKRTGRKEKEEEKG